MTRRSSTAPENSILMNQSIVMKSIESVNWGDVTTILTAETQKYLNKRHNDTSSDDGIYRARNVQKLLEKKPSDHTFHFALLCALFSVEDSSENRFVHFFKSITTSSSKVLASMIAEQLIAGNYSETHYSTQYSDKSTITIAGELNSLFSPTLLLASQQKCMGNGRSISTTESQYFYDKTKGVRFILSEMLKELPKNAKEQTITEMNALKKALITPIEFGSTLMVIPQNNQSCRLR